MKLTPRMMRQVRSLAVEINNADQQFAVWLVAKGQSLEWGRGFPARVSQPSRVGCYVAPVATDEIAEDVLQAQVDLASRAPTRNGSPAKVRA